MSFIASRSMNSRSATSFGQRVIATRSTGTGVSNSNSSDIGSNTNSNSGGINSRYTSYMASIINLILNVRNTSLTDLQTALTTLVGFQQLLGDFYSKSVDPTINNYNTVYYQIMNYDPFIYFLFFAYNLCDYQIIQYELTAAVNNCQQRYINLLQAKPSTNQGYTQSEIVSLSINTSIKNEYLNYIQFYGLPNKGLFIPSILERIRLGIINASNYKSFDPMVISIVDPALQEWVDTPTVN